MAEIWTQYGGPGRDFSLKRSVPTGFPPKILWRRALGEGTSGIVGDGARLFTMYCAGIDSRKQAGTEVIACLDAATGKTLWELRAPVAMLPKQESFTDDPIRPQSTPLLSKNRLLTLGFTGLLTCADTVSGRILWSHDLVKAFEATPVQFGFSSSPLLHDGTFVVPVGGKPGALMAFDPATGGIRWKSTPAEPAYASPILVRIDGEDQIVQLTRDALLGIGARDGTTRWTYPLPKPGLTNVPTPIALPDQRLLISGQGVLGTRLLKLSKSSATEVWANTKTIYFYCNWAATDTLVLGCNNGGLVTALRLRDGQELWRERGLSDANLLGFSDGVLFLRGDGNLFRARPTETSLSPTPATPLLTGRCWTPPTGIGSTLYARDNKEIVAARL